MWLLGEASPKTLTKFHEVFLAICCGTVGLRWGEIRNWNWHIGPPLPTINISLLPLHCEFCKSPVRKEKASGSVSGQWDHACKEILRWTAIDLAVRKSCKWLQRGSWEIRHPLLVSVENKVQLRTAEGTMGRQASCPAWNHLYFYFLLHLLLKCITLKLSS